MSNYKIRILLSEERQYFFGSLSLALQLLAAISENRIPSDKGKSFSMKKKGLYIYSFSNQNGVKFDSLLLRKITLSFP
jgi:hypothetical protein